MNQPANRAGGRGGSGGGSAGAKGAFLLVVAAILGIVLLQAFDTDFGGGGVGVDTGGTTIPAGVSTSTVPAGVTPTTPATVPTRAPSEVTVLVANGTGIRGLGGQTADQLHTLGYVTPTAVDATKALDATGVQFAEGYQNEAKAIALTLGLPATAVTALNSPAVPDTQGANVVVLLGADVGRNVTTTSSVP